MLTTWQALIDRAKTYVDDDHTDERSWITDERWLTLANVEYAQLYRRWVRSGLVTPSITTGYMTGTTTAFAGVLALVGVARDFGDFVRLLQPAQQTMGRGAFWRGTTAPHGASTMYAATGGGDTVTVELDWPPNDLVAPIPLIPAVPAVKSTLSLAARSSAIPGISTVLRRKTAGAEPVPALQVWLIPDGSGAVPTWTQDVLVAPRAICHFDFTLTTTADFEASIAANPSLPFEVMTASGSRTTLWSAWSDIQNFNGIGQAFSGGSNEVPAVPLVPGNYIVRYVPTVAYATDANATIELPYGTDERVVLGMARRASLKDHGASALLDRLTGEADAEMNFSATGKQPGMKVRVLPRQSPLLWSTPSTPLWPDRTRWLYL